MRQPAILVFSKTLGWRHDEGIAGADRFLADYALTREMGFFTTANAAVFNPRQLARFDVVVFNNVTGDALSTAQQTALRRWIEDGGGFIALHASGDDTHAGWQWYDREVIGPEFVGHPADPQFQRARVVSLAPDHPVLRGIPGEFSLTDEWYSFDGIDTLADAMPLLGLDEDSYQPENLVYGPREDLRMGGGPAHHPIAWVRCIGSGRSFYSAVGHFQVNYDDPVYRRFLENAVGWVSASGNGNHDGCRIGQFEEE